MTPEVNRSRRFEAGQTRRDPSSLPTKNRKSGAEGSELRTVYHRQVVIVLEDLEQRVEIVPARRMNLSRVRERSVSRDDFRSSNFARTGIDPGFSTTSVLPSFPGRRPSYMILTGPATTGGS